MKQSVTLLRRAQEGEIAVSRSAARRAAHSASGDQLPRMGGALGLELFLSACGWMTCGEVERIAHEGRPRSDVHRDARSIPRWSRHHRTPPVSRIR